MQLLSRLLVGVALLLLLPASLLLALQSTAIQRQVVFLHRLGWPPVRFESPELALTISGMPRVSHLLGLHSGLPRTEPHWLLNESDQIGVWLTLPDASCAGAEEMFVLYCHGNGEHRGWAPAVRKVKVLSRPPYCATVASFDYRGFGDSQGVPTESTLVDDSFLVWKWLADRQSPTAIGVVVGHSLGSAVALQLTQRLVVPAPHALDVRTPDALVLDAALSSIREVALAWLPPLPALIATRAENLIESSLAHEHRFDSLGIAPVLGAPPGSAAAAGSHQQVRVLMFHGSADRIVPIELGRRLQRALNPALHVRWVEAAGAGHEDAFDHPAVQAAARALWDDLKASASARAASRQAEATDGHGGGASLGGFMQSSGELLSSARAALEQHGALGALMAPAAVAASLQIALGVAMRRARSRDIDA